IIICNPQAFAGEQNYRLAADFFCDLDIGPGDAPSPAGAQDFEHGLLRREASGQVLVISLLIPGTVFLLGRREDAIQKSLAVLFDGSADTIRLDDIDAVADDGHVDTIAAREPPRDEGFVGGVVKDRMTAS